MWQCHSLNISLKDAISFLLNTFYFTVWTDISVHTKGLEVGSWHEAHHRQDGEAKGGNNKWNLHWKNVI